MAKSISLTPSQVRLILKVLTAADCDWRSEWDLTEDEMAQATALYEELEEAAVAP